MTFDTIFFYCLAIVSVGSALMVVTHRNPIIAALYLIVNFFCLAGLYLTLHAQFIAVIQILVYAGAIMVLFLFVIMLLNLGDEQKLVDAVSVRKVLAAGLSAGLLMEVLAIVGFGKLSLPPGDLSKGIDIGTVEYIGMQMFTSYLFPFEITSLLLLAAIVGAIVLAKKKLD